MNSSLSTVDLTSSSFESILVECYRTTYEKEDYKRIPEHLKEASGISGYTATGVVHSCLYSDYDETEDETYLSQSEHVTRSIEKLMNSPDLFINVLKVTKVYEWHLNVYEYSDTRILCHLKTKCDEVQLARAKYPEKYPHISDNIDIRVVAPDCFFLQIRSILSSRLQKKHIHIRLPQEIKPAFEITDKFRAHIQKFTSANDEDLDELVKIYSNYYSGGLIALERLKCDNNNIYLDVMDLANYTRNQVFINTHTNLASDYNGYKALFDEFHADLDSRFADIFTVQTLSTIKNYF
jgi:hypothetical protein